MAGSKRVEYLTDNENTPPRGHDVWPVENVKDFQFPSLESLNGLDWIVRSGRIGLLAEDSGHQDLGQGEWALAKGYALPMRTVIPAD